MTRIAAALLAMSAVAAAQEPVKLPGHQRDACSVAFSPDGTLLASGGADAIIRIWSLADKKQIRELKGHSGAVYGLAFSPKGDILASCEQYGKVKVWNVADGKELASENKHSGSVNALTFCNQGASIATVSTDQHLRLWDTSLQDKGAFKIHRWKITSVAASKDGAWVASASEGGFIKIVDAVSGKEAQEIKGDEKGVVAVGFSPTGPMLAYATETGKICFFDTEKKAAGQECAIPDGARANAIAWSPDGAWLVLGCQDGNTYLLDVEKGAFKKVKMGHERPVLGVAFSPDGAWIATACMDRSVRLMRVK